MQFFAGWITEYSLSVDNLFVFLLIMARFYVPRELQQAVLMWGILIALVLRAIFIVLGAAVIERYSWVFYIFGAFLVFTAVKLAREGESDDDEYEENAVVRWVSRVLPSTPDFHGTKLRVPVDGRMLWTPMLRRAHLARHDRPRVRARLDPGDLRPHAGGVHRLRGQRVRAARACASSTSCSATCSTA